MNVAKFLRIPFLTEHLQWLLLKLVSSKGHRRLGVRGKWQVGRIRGYQIILLTLHKIKQAALLL